MFRPMDSTQHDRSNTRQPSEVAVWCFEGVFNDRRKVDMLQHRRIGDPGRIASRSTGFVESWAAPLERDSSIGDSMDTRTSEIFFGLQSRCIGYMRVITVLIYLDVPRCMLLAASKSYVGEENFDAVHGLVDIISKDIFCIHP